MHHAALKKTDDIAVVWVLRKTEVSAILHVLLELLWLILAELGDLDLLLLLLNVGVFLFLGSTWKTLPWEGSSQEVEQDMANGLEVISSRLLVTDVSVDGSVSGSAGQVLTISEWDVLSV